MRTKLLFLFCYSSFLFLHPYYFCIATISKNYYATLSYKCRKEVNEICKNDVYRTQNDKNHCIELKIDILSDNCKNELKDDDFTYFCKNEIKKLCKVKVRKNKDKSFIVENESKCKNILLKNYNNLSTGCADKIIGNYQALSKGARKKLKIKHFSRRQQKEIKRKMIANQKMDDKVSNIEDETIDASQNNEQIEKETEQDMDDIKTIITMNNGTKVPLYKIKQFEKKYKHILNQMTEKERQQFLERYFELQLSK